MRKVAVLIMISTLLQACSAPGNDPGEVPADASGAFERAERLMSAYEYQAAREVLTDAWEADGPRPELAAMLAESELLTGRADRAVERLEETLEHHEGDVRLLFWLAVASSAAGRQERAAEIIDEALALAGEKEAVLYDLAEEFLRRGVPSVAGALYGKIIEVYPTESQFDIFSCLQLAVLHYANEDYDKAARVMKLAARPMERGDISILTPHESQYWIAVFEAMHLAAGGMIEEGITGLRNAAASYPPGIAADAALVVVLDGEGREEEASGVYVLAARRLADAINAEPEDARAYHEAALLSALSGREVAEGLRLCRWALTLQPLMGEFMDTKAALLLALGRHEEALRHSERAIALAGAARWSPPALSMTFALRRLDALEKCGVPVPAAFTRLP